MKQQMNYFLLTYSTAIKEIGTSMQVQELAPWYNPTLPNSYREIQVGKPIDFDLRVPEFMLAEYAKTNDLLQCVPMSGTKALLISTRFAELLKKFKLSDYQLFKTKVFSKKEEWDYYIFYFSQTFDEEFVDFSKSEFVLAKVSEVISPIKINSLSEYDQEDRKAWKDSNHLCYTSFVLKAGKIPYDFFRIYRTLFSGFFVSERLKNAIEAAGLTGMAFKPVVEIGPRD